MENCFWEKVQSFPNLTCLNPSLLNNEVNRTKPKCQDNESELAQMKVLWSAMKIEAELLRNCNCSTRCIITDYHISGNPTGTCGFFSRRVDPGTSYLYVVLPSKRVRLQSHQCPVNPALPYSRKNFHLSSKLFLNVTAGAQIPGEGEGDLAGSSIEHRRNRRALPWIFPSLHR